MLVAPREEADSKVSIEFSRYHEVLASVLLLLEVRPMVAYVETSQTLAVVIEAIVVEFNELLYI